MSSFTTPDSRLAKLKSEYSVFSLFTVEKEKPESVLDRKSSETFWFLIQKQGRARLILIFPSNTLVYKKTSEET